MSTVKLFCLFFSFLLRTQMHWYYVTYEGSGYQQVLKIVGLWSAKRIPVQLWMWGKCGVFQTALKEALHKIESESYREEWESESAIGSAQLHTSKAAHNHCCQKPALGALSTADRDGSSTRGHISWDLVCLWKRVFWQFGLLWGNASLLAFLVPLRSSDRFETLL